MRLNIPFNNLYEERAIRAGEFQLVADTAAQPLITSQPVNNFKQFTWLESVEVGVPIFQYIKPTDGKVLMLQGTEFLLGVESVDLSNTLNINDTTNLSYRWTRDDSPIYELNSMNGGIGTNFFAIPASSSISTLSGRYVCEISNAYGSTTSDPIDIEIIDPYNHPKLLKNLVLNGDGDGGLNGWQADSDIIVTPFISNAGNVRDFGSFRMAGWVPINGWEKYGGASGRDLLNEKLTDFYFTTGDDGMLFYNGFKKRMDSDPSFSNLNALSYFSNNYLTQQENDAIQWNLPQIIPNEDFVFNRPKPYAAFFPGIRYLDSYNQNISTISTTLLDEYQNYESQYFTRNKIRFEKDGGLAEVNMTQLVDLSDVSDMIDGNVYGVKYVTSQFFAYVGAGITGYSIKVVEAEGVKNYNFYLKDLEAYYNKHRLSANPGQAPMSDPNASPDRYLFMESDYGNLPSNIKDIFNNYSFWNIGGLSAYIPSISPMPGTPIEITPLVEDQTTIILEYLDETEVVLKKETLNGPTNKDVWAIKEKVYFPLTLYGIFEFINPTDNPINVFGQTYTRTTALGNLMIRGRRAGAVGSSINGSQWTGVGNTIGDVNARFLLNKYNFTRFREKQAYPIPFGFDNFNPNIGWRAVQDHGAAAMFGVGKNIIIPPKTRSVRITIKFKNTTQAFKDTSPKTKAWFEQEIYANDFGDGSGVSMRVHEYGNPRCGVTSVKFLLSPNDFKISNKYTSYQLPPIDQTVIGIQKAKYSNPNAFNTAIKTNFTYDLEIPAGIPAPPQVVEPYTIAQGFFDLVNGINLDVLSSLQASGSISVNVNTSYDTSLPDNSIQAEDTDDATNPDIIP